MNTACIRGGAIDMTTRLLRSRDASILMALVLSISITVPASPKVPPKWLWGCWVVTKLLPVTDASALSQEQEKAMIGRRIVFGPSCARSGQTIVKSPAYSTKTVSREDFFRLGYYVELTQIGVHAKQVTEVDLALPDNLSDLDFPGNMTFLREKDIVIVVEGDYFVAEKAKPGDPGCKCERTAK